MCGAYLMFEEEKDLERRFKESELSWRSYVQKVLDEIRATQKVRAEKYDNFLDMLIKREEGREAIRKAIIEKTLAGLVYSLMAAAVAIAWAGTKAEIIMVIEAIKAVKPK